MKFVVCWISLYRPEEDPERVFLNRNYFYTFRLKYREFPTCEGLT